MVTASPPTPVPGLIVAAARSGAGKTTVTLGLMRALARQGVAVQPCKCGPDYIDPAFHAAATGRPSFNLDTWAMPETRIAAILAEAGRGADLILAEGVMGLFDGVGAPGRSGCGATADLAALTGWPVLLVLDVSGQSETAAAIALGCLRYRADVSIAGVILNRVASPRHLGLIEPAFARLALPILGSLTREERLSLPERHLGLVQAGETADLEARLDALADLATGRIDLAAVRRLARPSRLATPVGPVAGLSPPGQRIALASDSAFSFLYPHLVMQWRHAGAEVVPFSPLADEAPDPAADAVWLPGGYPELHAGRIAAAERFKAGLRRLAGAGRRVHGECGGYMVLGHTLINADGTPHAMAGLLEVETSFADRRLHLGYRRARLAADCVLGRAGTEVLGHEFHYARLVACREAPLAACTDAAGTAVAEGGARRGAVTGTFFHLIEAEAG